MTNHDNAREYYDNNTPEQVAADLNECGAGEIQSWSDAGVELANSPKPTPPPWSNSTFSIFDSDKRLLADLTRSFTPADECQANTAHIVRCVNNFEPLLDAAEAAQALLRDEDDWNRDEWRENFRDVMTQLRAAIENARVK